ncbi:MAG: hypothetical protein ACKO6N_25615, partial [Myxococcota bacterium]
AFQAAFKLRGRCPLRLTSKGFHPLTRVLFKLRGRCPLRLTSKGFHPLTRVLFFGAPLVS